MPRTIDGDDMPPTTFEIVKLGRAMPFYVNRSEALLTWSPQLGASLSRLYRDRQFDVVHVHNPLGQGLPTAAARRSAAPVTVGTIHSVVPPEYVLLRLFRRRIWRTLQRLDALVSVSDAHRLAQAILSRIGVHNHPERHRRQFFSPDAEPLPNPDGKRTVLFIGRFDPAQRCQPCDQGLHNPAWHTRRCASRNRRRLSMRPLVERLVPKALREDVIFVDANRLRPRYLASADVLCSPCSLASFGMVVLEAMSAWCARGCDTTSRIRPRHARRRRRTDDRPLRREAAFALNLARVLDDRELAARMGARARQRAIEAILLAHRRRPTRRPVRDPHRPAEAFNPATHGGLTWTKSGGPSSARPP